MNDKKKTILLCLPSLLLGFIALSAIAGNAPPPERTVHAEEQKSTLEQASNEENQEEQEESKDQYNSVESYVSSIIADLNIDYDNISIIQGVDSGQLRVSYDYTGTAWDDTVLICDLLTDYINICQSAYQRDDIGKIELFIFGNMASTGGTSDRQKLLSICINKESFNGYDWDTIEFMPDTFDDIRAGCELLDIHAGIEQNVDFSKVYYKGG